MRLMSIQEVFRVLNRPLQPDRSIEQYAAELGTGLHLWVTLDGYLVAGIVVGLALGLSGWIALTVFLLGILAPIAMTTGYLLGAVWRGYPVWKVLQHAYRAIK